MKPRCGSLVSGQYKHIKRGTTKRQLRNELWLNGFPNPVNDVNVMIPASYPFRTMHKKSSGALHLASDEFFKMPHDELV